MEATYGKAESIIQDVAGCGLFQGLMTFFTYILATIPVMMSLTFMSFGLYNPGWRCLDNTTAHPIIPGNVTLDAPSNHNTSLNYNSHSCLEFDACNRAEFSPEASTIVTEWGLICGRSWISSIIITVQMAGGVTGSYVTGQLGDLLGRKKVVFGAIALLGICNFISIYSIGWEMYAILIFFKGMFASSIVILNFVLVSEFMTARTRNVVVTIPIWATSGVIFGISCMLLNDWRSIHIMETILCVIAFLPVVWVPESLRWLYVKKKTNEFRKTAAKVLKYNNKKLPLDFEENSSFGTYFDQDTQRYSIIHLFRKGLRFRSCCVALVWTIVSCTFYSMNFGVGSLHGNFYTNLIMLNALIVPCSVISMVAPDIIGRKKSIAFFFGLCVLGLLISTGLELWAIGNMKTLGTTILFLSSTIGLNCGWHVCVSSLIELYPTVVRSTVLGFGLMMARVGSMISPYLLPSNKDNVYIWYGVMCAMSFILCVLVLTLPETMGKRLQETFDKKTNIEHGTDSHQTSMTT